MWKVDIVKTKAGDPPEMSLKENEPDNRNCGTWDNRYSEACLGFQKCFSIHYMRFLPTTLGAKPPLSFTSSDTPG